MGADNIVYHESQPCIVGFVFVRASVRRVSFEQIALAVDDSIDWEGEAPAEPEHAIARALRVTWQSCH